MPTLTLDGRLIYFAHCPKTGGTSVERFMVDRWGDAVGMLGWGWDRHWAGRGARAGEVPSSPQHYIWVDARPRLARAPDAVFAVVREPVARMVSEYRYHRAGRLTGPLGRPLRRLGFSTWLRLMLAVAARNPYTHDNHFRPQADFLPDTGATVFQMEDGLAPVGDWLCRMVGAEEAGMAFPHRLKSRAGPAVVPSRQDIALIAGIYAGDYARFGYPWPALSEAPDDPLAGRRDALARMLAPAVDLAYRRGLV